MLFVMVGEEIQIPIGMGWFSIYINNESIILCSWYFFHLLSIEGCSLAAESSESFNFI